MSFRSERINSEMQKSISDIIQNRLKDPRVSGMVSVLGAEVAKDLKTAKVYVSIYGADEAKESLAALSQAAGFIRRELAVDFKELRSVPQLTFKLDESAEYSKHINELINKVKKDG